MINLNALTMPISPFLNVNFMHHKFQYENNLSYLNYYVTQQRYLDNGFFSKKIIINNQELTIHDYYTSDELKSNKYSWSRTDLYKITLNGHRFIL